MKLMIKKKIVKEPYQWFIKLKYQNLSELAENSLMKFSNLEYILDLRKSDN